MAQNPLGAPGQAEVWRIDNSDYLIYRVPETNAPMGWRIGSPEQKEKIFGPEGEFTYDKKYSLAEARAKGLLQMGDAGRLADFGEHDADPFAQMVEDLKIEAEVKPWLLEPEFMAIYGRAHMEGREPSDGEIKATDWWRNKTEGERSWITAVEGDPASARQQLVNNRLAVREKFQAVGWYDVPLGLVDYYADQWTHGEIGEAELEDRIMHELDPNLPGASPFAGFYLPENALVIGDTKGGQYVRIGGKDYELTGPGQIAKYGTGREGREPELQDNTLNVAGTILDYFRENGEAPDTTALGGHEEVQQLVNDWLGPYYAQNYDEAFVSEWASRLRETPNSKDQLVELLRGRRLAAFPEHENASLRYADIAPLTKTVWQNVLGQLPDEMDETFLEAMRMPDVTATRTLLTKHGLKKNNGKVIDDALNGLMSTFGNGVVGGMR